MGYPWLCGAKELLEPARTRPALFAHAGDFQPVHTTEAIIHSSLLTFTRGPAGSDEQQRTRQQIAAWLA